MADVFEKGTKAPDFELFNQDEKKVCLSDFTGKYLILYFYPKDNTPGCTIEAKDFTCLVNEFAKLGGVIAGVSADSPKSHTNFISKQDLGVDLLSDPDKNVMKAYKAWGIKKNYGKEYEGIIRSTFIISPDGTILKHWKNVRAKGHAERVLKEFKTYFS